MHRMNSPVLFSERQYFRQWWVWLIIISINGLALFGFIKQVLFGKTFGDKPMSDVGLTIFLVFSLVISAFFIGQHLSTKINEQGVYVKFWPYHKGWRLYTWEQIADCKLKQYNPIAEYGGWGLRLGAYNVSGDLGLLLTFKSGKNSLLIGTNKPHEMKAALEQLGKV